MTKAPQQWDVRHELRHAPGSAATERRCVVLTAVAVNRQLATEDAYEGTCSRCAAVRRMRDRKALRGASEREESGDVMGEYTVRYYAAETPGSAQSAPTTRTRPLRLYGPWCAGRCHCPCTRTGMRSWTEESGDVMALNCRDLQHRPVHPAGVRRALRRVRDRGPPRPDSPNATRGSGRW